LGRAIIFLVVAVVVGVLLLGVAARPPVGVTASETSTTTTTTVPTTTTTVASTVPPSSISVLVANGTSSAGLAQHYTTLLQDQGWATKTPTDVTGAHVTSSKVYYTADQKASAESIASQLGLPKSAVQPLTSSVPVSGSTGVDVVVVIGSDLATTSTSTTTT
jgi:hypothetical protein